MDDFLMTFPDLPQLNLSVQVQYPVDFEDMMSDVDE